MGKTADSHGASAPGRVRLAMPDEQPVCARNRTALGTDLIQAMSEALAHAKDAGPAGGDQKEPAAVQRARAD